MLRRLYLTTAIIFAALIGPAAAQSVPVQLSYGQVPTPGQWSLAFSAKQDVLGYVPLNAAGGTLTGKLWLAPSSSFQSGLNCGVGVAPTTPINSDLWCTSAGLFMRANGITVGPFQSGTFTVPQVITLNAGGAPTPLTNTALQIVGVNAMGIRSEIDSFGGATYYSGVRSDGTLASPTAVQSGEEIMSISAWAYNGAAVVGPIGRMRFFAAENIASGHQGSEGCIATTPTASTTLADGLCQQPSGGVTVGSPTGGDEGAGALNAAALYLNGSALGSAATHPSSFFLQAANNLSDLASASTARTNLGLGALATVTPGANIATALANALNAQNGVPSVFSASLTAGHCLEWGPGIEDTGAPCPAAGGNVSNVGTPTNNQLAQWTSATTIQGITPGTGIVTALEANLNAATGFVGVNNLGSNVLAAIDTALNANGGVPGVNGAITAGHCLKWSSTGIQDFGGACGGTPASSAATISSPTAPASTSAFAMQGLAGSITPATSGNVLITVLGTATSSAGATAGNGISYQLSYGTGVAPGNGASLTGTQIGVVQEYTNPSAPTAVSDVHVPFSVTYLVTGLVPGTAYWIDLAAKSVGTASSVGLSNVAVVVAEQ